MDLNAIAIFVHVVDAQSFVGAAKAAGIPKSTVARRIDALEESLGVRLLQRSTRHSHPTEAGRAFYIRSKKILADIKEAATDVSCHGHEARGKLRVTASVLMAETYLGGWAIEYLRAHPRVDLDMVLSTESVDLIAGGFDVAIRVGALVESNYIVRKLAPAPSVLCASPAYLEAAGVPEQPEALAEHRCVVFSPDGNTPPWELENARGETRTVTVHGQLTVNSLPVVLEACQSGTGIALLPTMVACGALNTGAVVRVLPGWANQRHWVHALFPSRDHLSAAVRTFIDFVAARLTPPPWELDDARDRAPSALFNDG